VSSRAAPRVGDFLNLVRFSHSIFALPFALAGAWLAARGLPPLATLGWILVCAVAARTAAMSFNRWLDADLDGRNPRTRAREIPSGKIARRDALVLALAASAVFVAAAFALNRACGWLSPIVLAVLYFYSFTKRFTPLAHVALGLSLGLAPLGAWLAVRGDFGGDLAIPILLALAVTTWVAGFDLIYACQDVEFDRGAGLHSIPSRFGARAALATARVLHFLTVGCLSALWGRADLSWLYLGALALVAILLVWEHSLVRHDDLSRVDLAFFTINGWIGVLFFVGLALDLHFLSKV
jgi:4-hydroxybenzoate polyprenyltransferase